MSIGIGLGISSCLSFFLLLGGALVREQLLITESLLFIILVICFLYRSRARKERIVVPGVSPQSIAISGTQKVICISFLITLALSLMIFAALTWENPHGGNDAFAIWNLRARFLFRAESYWTDAFSKHLSWSNLDYPLLIPTNVARGWVIVGNDTVAIPIFLALLFTFGTVGLTVSGLLILRGKTQAFLAGSILLGTPFFVQLGASQVADVPLGFFFLSTLVLLSLRKQFTPYEYRIMFLAGLSAGFSAWTKNEGLLFLPSIPLSLFVVAFACGEKKAYLKQIGYFLLGALPILVIIIFFKTQIVPANVSNPTGSGALFSEVTAHPTSAILIRLSYLARHLAVLTALQREIRNFGGWPFSMPVMLVFYLLVLGLTINAKFKEEVVLLVTTLSLMFVGYYLAYIVEPHDLTHYSVNRVLTQLWGSAIFAYFMIVRTIEEVSTIKETQIASNT